MESIKHANSVPSSNKICGGAIYFQFSLILDEKRNFDFNDAVIGRGKIILVFFFISNMFL